MICPNCLENAEVAYSAVTGNLICLGPGCNWERSLDEDETFELFFGSKRSVIGEASGAVKALVHECAS
jgi:hypothetical protein